MCAGSPGRRISPGKVLEEKMFAGNAMLVVIDFLENIRGLTGEEKMEGFRTLPPLIRTLPSSTITTYILPLLLSSSLFVEPHLELFFTDLFAFKHPNPLIPTSTYTQYVLPFISEMLRAKDYGVRVKMLKMWEGYVEALVTENPLGLQTWIIPELLSGFQEYNDEIYILTHKAACHLLTVMCSLPISVLSVTPHGTPIPLAGLDPPPRQRASFSGGSITGLTIPSNDRQRNSISGDRLSVSGPSGATSEYQALDSQTEKGTPITQWMMDRNIVPKTIRCCIWKDELKEEESVMDVVGHVMKMWKVLSGVEAGLKVGFLL
ncbi:Protein-associating with the carboxyl-terminal domain of ezrin [Phlyctochytrium planicorne]|nr:Protein-associating with the carboxyl-terminal domain of ezrin [Phlyctochytrium planicorne]